MTKGVNKAIIIGNLGQDPDVKHASSGGAVANISVATSDTWKDKQSGESQERTEWHRIVFFGKLAEIVGQYLKKGSKVYIEGRLQTRKWTDKAGVERYTTEIIASEMQMLDGKRDDGAPAQHQAAPAPARSPTAQPDFDDEIPFAPISKLLHNCC